MKTALLIFVILLAGLTRVPAAVVPQGGGHFSKEGLTFDYPVAWTPADTGDAGVLNGGALKKPQPQYPSTAKGARAQGTVVVQTVVDEKGDVSSAVAASGHPLLQPAGAEAARTAKFEPTTVCGQPVKVSGVITYHFVLM
ncbi:MAG TPA: TonB family protein [Pyrinomonadaceae bacterium]